MKSTLEQYLDSFTSISSAQRELSRLIEVHKKLDSMPDEIKSQYLALQYQLNTLIAVKTFESVGGRLNNVRPQSLLKRVSEHIAIVKSNKFAECKSTPNDDNQLTAVFIQRMKELGYSTPEVITFEFPD